MAFGFRPFRSCPAAEDMHAATTSLVITRPLLLGVSVTLRSANKLWSEVPIWPVLYVFYSNPRSGGEPKRSGPLTPKPNRATAWPSRRALFPPERRCMTQHSTVIVGSGHAGVQAAASLRE